MSDDMADAHEHEHEPVSTPSKERHSLTLDQRRALRRWASSQPVRPSHKACIDWFQGQYNQTISQSTVSHSLSPKYARLDGDTQLSGSRLRFGNWPDVEKLVLFWHQGMVNSGRHPSNEELAEKAKTIFTQLPRYKDETPPEFSPGWIHRFKKRYGLLIRRQRRHNSLQNPADDIPYLVDAVPRFMTIAPDVSPAAIRDTVQRIVGVEPSLAICARVRDEIVRRLENPHASPHPSPGGGGGSQPPLPGSQNGLHQPQPLPGNDTSALYPPTGPSTATSTGPGAGTTNPATDEDPEMALQNALRALQQEEADAEAQAAAERDARASDRGSGGNGGLPPQLGAIAGQAYAQQQATAAAAAAAAVAAAAAANNAMPGGGSGGGGGRGASVGPAGQQQTPGSGASNGAGAGGGGSNASSSASSSVPRFVPPTPNGRGGSSGSVNGGEDLTLTPIPSGGPVSATERPVRCPYCLNQRMLRTIKEAVEHMSTHVIV